MKNDIDHNIADVIRHRFDTNQVLTLSEFSYIAWTIKKLDSIYNQNLFIRYAIKHKLDRQKYLYKVWAEFYSISLVDNKDE
ncbi:MAG: hypothetical protein AABY22_36440 [Nanoarchaeota archaeon]